MPRDIEPTTPVGETPSPPPVGGEPGGGGQTSPAASPPAISAEEFARAQERADLLQTELDRERNNVNNLRQGYQDEHRRRLELESHNQTLARQREAEIAAWNAASAQEPDIDWGRFRLEEAGLDLADPLRDTLGQHGQFVEGRILTAMRPVAEAAQRADQATSLALSTAATLALRQTKEDWESSGFDMSTWAAIEEKVRGHLEGNPNALAAAMRPSGGATTAFYFAKEAGLPVQSAPSNDPLPVQATGGPSGEAQSRIQVTDPVVRERVTSLEARMGRKLTEDEVDEVQSAFRMGGGQ